MNPHSYAKRSRLPDLILIALLAGIVIEQFHPFTARLLRAAELLYWRLM